MEQKESKNRFHDELKIRMDKYAHLVYGVTRKFPKEELYGITSQVRRSALLVVLNYIEGYARKRNKVYKNFLEIAYGSLQESKYLLGFSLQENFLSKGEFGEAMVLADGIGAMLWSTIDKVN